MNRIKLLCYQIRSLLPSMQWKEIIDIVCKSNQRKIIGGPNPNEKSHLS